ncbi:MAG: outer membrane lipoprotein-sorting protein, partial [Gammaproteobacteria bacterium]
MKRLTNWFLIVRRVWLPLGMLGLCFANVHAKEATPEAIDIARERKLKDSGWGTTEAELAMVLYSKSGDTSSRSLRIRTMEVQNDGNKSLIIFEIPFDVKGTAVLTYSHITGSDDQWIFLPSIKRVKRISSDNKSGAFMGSEFAFEDLSSYEVEKYDYKYLGDDLLD